MTSDQLKELERLNHQWANPKSFDNDTASSHEVMDLLPDVIQALKEREGLMANLDYSVNLAIAAASEKLTAERDAAIQGMMNETTRVNSFINDTIVLRQERDAALKALDAANAKCADLQLTIDGLNVGYHADSEWRIVVEALKWAHNREQSACICGESGENHTECPVAKALAHAERITGGGK